MFAENTAAFLPDFGTRVSFAPYEALAIFDQPDKDVLGDRAISADYTIEYRTLDLPGLAYGSQVTIGGTVYTVIDVMAIDDGTFSRARLEI